MEKAGAEIGPVDLGMAVDADLRRKKKIALVPLAMALDANATHVPMRQEETVGGAMGGMTDGAALVFNGGVFEDPGAPFLGMALETDVEVEFIPPPQTGPGAGAMGGMTVGTEHGAFQHFMAGREEEFEFDLLMTGEAEVGLFGFEEFRLRRGPVNPMAVIAAQGA
jgi:hypothetical protein